MLFRSHISICILSDSCCLSDDIQEFSSRESSDAAELCRGTGIFFPLFLKKYIQKAEGEPEVSAVMESSEKLF